LNHENLGLHFNDNFATSWEQILHCQHVRKEVGNERQKTIHMRNGVAIFAHWCIQKHGITGLLTPQTKQPLKQCSSSIHTPTHTTADFEKKMFSSRSIFLNYMTMSSTLVQSARLLLKNDISNYNEPGSSQWTCIFNLPHTEDQTQLKFILIGGAW
jgi:hypothetical protein